MAQAPQIKPDWRTMGRRRGEPQDYCTRCGKLLDVRYEGTGEYSMFDGTEYVRRVVRCPNKRWWNNHVADSHVIYVPDANLSLQGKRG